VLIIEWGPRELSLAESGAYCTFLKQRKGITNEQALQNAARAQGTPAAKLSLTEFSERFHARFTDPAFGGKSQQIEQLLEVAWDGYRNARKSPITRRAGDSFADPNYDLSVDWLRARAAIRMPQRNHDRPAKCPRHIAWQSSRRRFSRITGLRSTSSI
jgi:hypothetical protein